MDRLYAMDGRSPWRVALFFVAALIITGSFADGESSRRTASAVSKGGSRPSFAFHYEPRLTEEGLDWYSQFDVLVTHDPLPREQVRRLHAAGTKLLFYEWATAFYESLATEWQRSLISARQGDLLNETPLTGGAGSDSAGAWYFDPLTHAHEFGRAADLARRVESSGYDGIFFDATTFENVQAVARQEYRARHPAIPYDLAFSRFLFQLRKKLPNGILFTNQGYRSAAYYLPYVDWDLTESLITRPALPGTGSYEVRPWNDPNDRWNSISVAMRNVEQIAARYPHVKFGHLNYAGGANAEMIQLVTAVAQLFDTEAYVAAPWIRDEVDAIYFRNRGRPVGPRIDWGNGQAAYRFYENGVIAVTAATEQLTIENDLGKPLRNHFTGELICTGPIILPAANGALRPYFFDFDESSNCPGA